MINLIKNEFVKIFGKISFYVLLLAIIAVVLISTFLYKSTESGGYYPDDDGTYYTNYSLDSEKRISELEKSGRTRTEAYVNAKSDLEMFRLLEKYAAENWKRLFIINDFRSLITEINTIIYTDGLNEETSTNLKELENERDIVIKKLEESDWKFFERKTIEKYQKELENRKQQLSSADSTEELNQIKMQIMLYETSIKQSEYRINNNIAYDAGYLDRALNEGSRSYFYIYQYENGLDTTDDEKSEYENKKVYYDNLEKYNINKYVIDNSVDGGSENDAKSFLSEVFNKYSIVIVVVLLIYACSIVTEEFNKGTIKLLLVRPHSRTKVLLSKFITLVLLIPIIIAFVVLVQTIVIGIAYGFESFQNPVLAYDHNNGTVLSMNVYKYIFIQSIYMMPLFILILATAFCISIVLNNSSLALAGTLLLYMFFPYINKFAEIYHIEEFKYFITMNWDIRQYIFGRIPDTEFTTLPFSLAICLIYFVAIMAVSIVNFKNKEIKNI